MKQEMAYLDLWAKINRYALDGGELVLSDGTDKNQLRFVRPVKVEPKPLRDTRWVLTGFEESDGPSVSHTTLVEGTEIDLVFAEENRISGTAGVNRFTGTCYALATSPKLAVRKLATTKKAGPPQAMAQETRFLQRLRSAIRYQIDGDRLTLSDESGAHRLLFEAAE
jgi:heat shock protein HslJ